MRLVNFSNEQTVRAEGAAFLMQLVTSGNLLAAFKMTNGDRIAFTELDRQLGKIKIIFEICNKF